MISFSTIYPKVYSDWDRQESFNNQIVDHTVILKDAINAIKTFKKVTFTGIQNDINNTFTLASSISDSLLNFNGQALVEGTHYTISGVNMTIIDALFTPKTTDTLEIRGNY